MQDPSEARRGFPVAFLIGVLVVAGLVGGAYLATQHDASLGPKAPPPLPMGPAEETYASRIHFLDLKMSRAANLLNQEVTYVVAALSNDGDRSIRDLEVTVEFRDILNQVVLRDKRRPLGPRAQPIEPLRRREIELTFEHIPEEWNRQYPTIRVTGLVLE